tara:strand:- start:1914 stop:3416 length:1503 start_codon:yes stop_codon:yes gene_type:complete
MNYKKINFILIVLSSILLADSSLSGNINFYSAFRASNSSLIRLPYRLTNLNFQHQKNDVQLNSSISIEHHIRKDVETLDDNSPQDFLFDIREIYLSYFTDFGEFRFGKQIHSWGMVDENSPMDNINAYDYYYLFLGGADKKLGSFSGTIEFYYNDWKFATLFSPIHHTNRIPINDENFPIELAAIPRGNQIMASNNSKLEYGGYLQRSFSNSEFRLSYFNGYDRLFNFSGINIFIPSFASSVTDLSFTDVDIVYGYRKTNMIGFGTTLLFDNFTLRADIAQFISKDQNDDVIRENPNTSDIAYQFYTQLGARIDTDLNGNQDTVYFSFPINEKAEYFQYTIQLEYNLPMEISMIAQLSSFDLTSFQYTDHDFPDDIDIPNFDDVDLEDLSPENLFTPGMGTTISTLSPNALILNFEKLTYNDRIKISFLNILDIDNPNFSYPLISTLIEYRCEFQVSDNFILLSSINTITGDKDHKDGKMYPFNQMEDFSHYRLELKYYF